jgi:sugar lactone lactonase YvrE/predicted Ser/Thr protein kinase
VTADTRVGSELAGYRIEQTLGRGGMSVVYIAEHVRLNRKVALKLLAPELSEDERFRERFLRESQLAASLDHPNVIPIYDADEADGVLYIAMRFVEGADLRGLLVHGPLEPRRAVSLLSQVASALDAAHRRGLVHRDVKPANILISSDEHVYLSDFGLTKQASSTTGLTATGQLVGTLDYVAPEQIQGQAVDGRTDEYSLGCVLYECLTGTPPYRKESEVAVLWAHMQDPPPRVSDAQPELPRGLDDVVGRALAKDPTERYGTCGELIEAARAALGISTGALPQIVRARRRPTKRILISAAVAIALLLAAAIAAVVLAGGGDSDATPLALAKNGVAVIDPKTGDLVGQVSLTARPGEITIGNNSVWVANPEERTVWRIDPQTRRVAETVGIGEVPEGLAFGRGALWIATRSGVLRYEQEQDPALVTLRVERPRGQLPYLQSPPLIAYGGGRVWFAWRDQVWRINPATNEIAPAATTLDFAGGLAADDAAGWVETLTGSVYRADAQNGETNRTANIASGGTMSDTGANLGAIASDGSAVWGSGTSGLLWKIDPAIGNPILSIDVRADRSGDSSPVFAGVAAGDGSVWSALYDNGKRTGTITKVDTASNRATIHVPFPNVPDGIAVDDDAVWVSSHR